MSWYYRQRMLFDLAARELSYRQIGAKYGKTENNVKQLAWYYRAEIAKRRARLYAELRLACSGEKQYRVGVLKQIISEIDERITEIAEAAKALDLRTLEDQAVWNNYHSAFCRYRELQADVVRQLREELDPPTRRAREEDVVDIDQLFDPVCPRCKEPISDEHELGNTSGE